MSEVIETTAEAVQSAELIKVVQLPVIFETLESIKKDIQDSVDYALSLECTEDSYKEIKDIRAKMNADFKRLEDLRKSVKKEVMKPYDEFEAHYKECVTDIFKPSDNILSERINTVTDGLKAQKKEKAQVFFDEYVSSKNIDFLALDNVGITFSMNISDKKCRETISEFVDKIVDEIAMIDTQENADEIFVEYKKTLNVSKAILLVKERHQAIEQERARQAVARAKAEQEAKLAAQVDEAVAESVAEETEQADMFSAPVEMSSTEIDETTPEEMNEDTILQASFRVFAKIDTLKKLVKFMNDEGIEYEQF